MDYRTAFPSKWMKASDFINGEQKVFTIASAGVEDVGDTGDKSLTLHFVESEQRLTLNRTNADTLGDMFGQDTDFWINQRITLHTEPTTYAGKRMMGVRIVYFAPNGQPQTNAAQPLQGVPPLASQPPAPQVPPVPQPQQAAPALATAAPQFKMAEHPPSAYDLNGLQQMVAWLEGQGPGHPQLASFQDEIRDRQATNRASIPNQPAAPAPTTPAPHPRTPVPAYPDDDEDPFADA